jgi:predicted DNA-binding transcriptional regulator YafY
VRRAIRNSTKLRVAYADESGATSVRVIWPLGLYFYSHVTLVCAWCELRAALRAFRADRIATCEAVGETFDDQGGALLARFLETHRDYSPPPT